MFTIKRNLRALCILTTVFPISACVTMDEEAPRRELLPKYALQTETIMHEVRFSLSSSSITASEKERISKFLTQEDVRAGDMVKIELIDPSSDALAKKRQLNLVALFDEYGVRSQSMTLPGSIGHRIRVAYQKVTPAVTACTGWTNPDRFGYSNQPMMNVGCATQSNLLNSLADKRDLYETRTPEPTRAERLILLEQGRVASAAKKPEPLSAAGFQAGDQQ